MIFSLLLIVNLQNDGTWEVSKEITQITTEEGQSVKKKITHLKFEQGSLLTSLEKGCFENSLILQSINLSNCLELESINEDVFKNCQKLTTVILPGDKGILENIYGGAFASTAITTIVFPKTLKNLWNHSTTFKMGVFTNSTLSNISYYSENNLEYVDNYVFRECHLTGFEIGPNLDFIAGTAFEKNPPTFQAFTMKEGKENSKYSIHKGMLYESDKLVFCPPGISIPNLKKGTNVIGIEAFHSNTMAVCDFLPETVESLETWVFAGCPNLVKVILPSKLENLNNSLFAYCPKLTTVIFPPNIKVIPVNLFYQSPKINVITIPYGVIEIQNCSFYGCKDLKYIYIPDTVVTFGVNIFKGSGIEECGIICSQSETKVIKDKVGLDSQSFKACKTIIPTCNHNRVHTSYSLFAIFLYYHS